MKRIILSLSIALLFGGCFKNGPEEAAIKFLEAIQEGDVSNYEKYSTSATQQMFSLAISMQCSGEKSECMKKTFQDFKHFKVVNTENIAEDKAAVTVEEYKKNGEVIKETFKMEKIADVWKVHYSK